MNLTSLLTTALAAAEVKQMGPRLVRRALGYGLLALAVVCLLVAVWRALDLMFGPLLAPLVASAVLALASAAVFFWLERRERRKPIASNDTLATAALLAPVVATVVAPVALPVLKYMLHPKRIAMLAAFGSLAAAVNMAGKASAPRRRPPGPSRTTS